MQRRRPRAAQPHFRDYPEPTLLHFQCLLRANSSPFRISSSRFGGTNAKFRKVDCNFSSIVLACAANAEETSRAELKKADLTGTNMEVIISIVEAKPGAGLPRHIHPGEEAYYVLEGATLELPDGKQVPLWRWRWCW